MSRRQQTYAFIREKIPFAITGFIATGINYGLYLLLVNRYLPPVQASVVAYSSSVVLNFFMQRYFVFELKRSARSAFAYSMLVSLGGLCLDAALVWALDHNVFLSERQYLLKLIVTGIVFFYNYYAKRTVFEGKWWERSAPKEPNTP